MKFKIKTKTSIHSFKTKPHQERSNLLRCKFFQCEKKLHLKKLDPYLLYIVIKMDLC